jgi:hypothetical protein
MGPMREVQISPQVAELLGAEEIRRLTSDVWDVPVQCWECGEQLTAGEPVSLLVVVPTDVDNLAFAVHAHPACSDSAVKRYSATQIRARFPLPADDDREDDVEAVALVWTTSAGAGYPALFLSYRAEVLLADRPERTDALVSGLIREGWHLASTLDAPPPAGPPGVRLRFALDPAAGVGVAELLGTDGAVETAVTVTVPLLWYPALRAGGQVAVFHGSRYLQHWQDRGPTVLSDAARAGVLVGGLIPAELHWPTASR